MKTLLILLDTLRRDYLRCYGNDWVHSPNLTRLAERSVVFENHWVGSLPCMPARREFMTGRHNFLHRTWGPIEPFDDVLPIELEQRKVFSHLITDHYHYFELGGENYHTCFDTWDFYRGQESDPWVSLVDAAAMPETLSKRMNMQNWKNRSKQLKEEDFSAARTAQAAVRWLEENKAADHWFMQVEIFDPHEPFYCAPKYRELYGDAWDGPLFDWPAYDEVKESPEAVAHIRKCYAGLLTMTDAWVGKIFDTLDALDLWKDTLVILSTDHGTMLAEHDYWMKNYMPVYNEIAHIPLLVHLPGSRKGGTRCGALTQSVDVMPTILEHHGCTIPPHVYGHSFLKALEGQPTRQDAIFGYFGKALNLVDGKHVYMRNPVSKGDAPIYEYTAMPARSTWFRNRDQYDKIEMGRYFGHAYNMPLYKIPGGGGPPKHHEGEPSYAARHQLWDLEQDYKQAAPLDNPALEKRLAERIRAHMQACEAPVEQYARLGLEPVICNL
ncbi:MAG: sulfatase [Planctomycetota bacterium]|nr:sulfatase [Planctomycetota bacterium]